MTRLLVKPPPAPSALRYRDPTIEDVEKFYDVHTSGDVPENMLEIYARVLAALNAIGAKMAEGEG